MSVYQVVNVYVKSDYESIRGQITTNSLYKVHEFACPLHIIDMCIKVVLLINFFCICIIAGKPVVTEWHLTYHKIILCIDAHNNYCKEKYNYTSFLTLFILLHSVTETLLQLLQKIQMIFAVNITFEETMHIC